MPEQPKPADALLSFCAALPWFDAALLQALSGEPAQEIAALLASALVVQAKDGAGYRLRDDVQARERERDGGRSSLNVTRHSHIFEHLAARIGQTEAESLAPGLEDACRHHLEQIFLDFVGRNNLPGLRRLVVVARPQLAGSARLVRWLDFYESFVDVRRHEYERGVPALERLLALTELEPKLRTQALNALGNAVWARGKPELALTYYAEAQSLAAAEGAR